MTSQALYNRWRSQTFDDVLGQEHITATLRNQIRAGRIGHAYLFTGVRGTGKTSTARILAKAVNCVGGADSPPCNACHICQTITAGRSLDLIEIDGASNRGIDEIRDLRDRVNFVPQEARFKVYVIDEVHMLTKEAFNALLKTLEEPPPHVIFVLCTTEAYRLPDTILSRCQRYDFRRAAVQTIVLKLQLICREEGVEITPEALDYIARRAAGSFRDAESLLDQVAAYAGDVVDLALVQRALGAVPAEAITDLIAAMLRGDAARGLSVISAAMDDGADPRQFLGEILEQMRALLLLGVGSDEPLAALGADTVAALRGLLRTEGFSGPLLLQAIRAFQEAGQDLRNSVRPQLPLELALVEAAMGWGNAPQMPVQPERVTAVMPDSAPIEQVESDAVQISANAADKPAEQDSRPSQTGPQPEPGESQQEVQVSPTTPQLTLEWVRARWSQVLNKVSARNPSVGSLLLAAHPVRVREGVITVGLAKAFERDQLAELKRSAPVEQVMSEMFGVPCRIECIIQAKPVGQPTSTGTGPSQEHLFAAADRQEKGEQDLLNHPAVKALEQRGGQVTRVEWNEAEDQSERR